MTNLVEVQNILYRWLDGLGLDRQIYIQPTNQSEFPRDNSPFVALSVLEQEVLGQPQYELAADGLTETIKTLTGLSVTIDVFGDGQEVDSTALNVSERIKASLWTSNRTIELFGELGLNSLLPVQDLGALEGGHLGVRYRLVIRFNGYIDTVFSSPDYFDALNLEVRAPLVDYDETVEVTV